MTLLKAAAKIFGTRRRKKMEVQELIPERSLAKQWD